jgi:ABC-type antimicrobial peptide transport system permease subunit
MRISCGTAEPASPADPATALLYGVSPTHPVKLVSVALILTGVAVAASLFPARRAIRVDAMAALRN